jgi:hypothetical protein
MKSFFLFLIFFLMTVYPVHSDMSFDNPRVGIVISKTSFDQRWGVTQMAAHGWAGIANLAGIPYDCLFLEDLTSQVDLSKYQSLIIGQCTYVTEKDYQSFSAVLKHYLEKGGNLIIDGPLATHDEQAQERDHTTLDDLIGISYKGFKGNSLSRVKLNSNQHYITRPFENQQFITQHLVNGLNILDFVEGSHVLLITGDEKNSYPFLTVREDLKNRIILVSDFSTWAGVPSFFRNVQPQVFYRNLIFNVLIRALQWSVYGDIASPIPVPQLSNANLTAIIRLDADVSGNLNVQVATINYLTALAKETGVVPVYGWVSSAATKAGWQDLAPLGKKIEEVGGEIGTHSRFHRIDREMTEKRWKEELDDAVQEIEFNMSDYDYPIGKVDFFINPGNTIYMNNYQEIAKRFSFYMTHGFEQDMPLGYGNLTWYTGPYKNFVVLENIPSPDYQWFYDPTWSYTTQQITAFQEAIFDHLFENIQRGVLYNQMWHDYSITSQSQYGKDRIMNENNIAMYDALKAKFATRDIYCPTPVELTNKLLSMAQWNYRWKSSGNNLELTIDFSRALTDTLPFFTGGMGIKIDNTNQYIQKVIINGKDHWAFNERVVILPNLKKGTNSIMISLGAIRCNDQRLIYVSSLMPEVRKRGDDLEVAVLTKSKARVKFYSHSPVVLINSDAQEWNRNGNSLLSAYVNSDRTISLRKLDGSQFLLNNSTVPIKDLKQSKGGVSLTIAPAIENVREIIFQSQKAPAKVTFGTQNLEVIKGYVEYKVVLPEYSTTTDLTISF